MNNSISWRFYLSVPLIMVLGLLIPPIAQAAEQIGVVTSGDMPIAQAKVTLYQAGTGESRRARVLGSTTADESGFFRITYTPPATDDAVLYLIADGPRREINHRTTESIIKSLKNPFRLAPVWKFKSWIKSRKSPIRLTTVLGTAPFPTEVVINELTTVASAYSLAQFFIQANLNGKSPGLQNAAMMVQNFVDLETGETAPVLEERPNGDETSTLNTFNSLANMVAACVREARMCSRFFNLTAPPRGPAPRNTLQALVDIVHNPWQNVRKLFRLSLESSVYQPALEPFSAPPAWTLALRFSGVPETMNGPGNIAFDASGNAWVTNNFDFTDDPTKVCGSDLFLTLQPNGQPLFDPPSQGGGLSGAGFGITFDPAGDVWVGNFGFKGPACDETVFDNSVSKFNSLGIPLSPNANPPLFGGGFTSGPMSQPQGTVSDRKGNIWIASCGNNTVIQYPKGDHSSSVVFAPEQIQAPFDIAFNLRGWAFITGNQSNNVVVLRPNGSPIRGSPIEGKGLFDLPLGIAADSKGNMWVANSAAVEVPCPLTIFNPDSRDGSLTLIRSNGIPVKGSPFTGGGLTMPWGVAVDGNDNVWVANFFARRISQFCGGRRNTAPPVLQRAMQFHRMVLGTDSMA